MHTARRTRAGLTIFVMVVSALLIAPSAQAEAATGVITGRITESDGAPASGQLFVSNLDGSVFRYVRPDLAGYYTIADLPAAQYTAQFTTDWGGSHQATPNPVLVPGQSTTYDIVLPPTGAIEGTFSRIADVTVSLGDRLSTRTDASGSWRIEKAFARDDYTVRFEHWQLGFLQYAYGKSYEADAARIAVAAGETTVVNDVLLPAGTVVISARDSVTGAPIPAFSAHLHNRGGQTTTGELVLEGIPAGVHEVTVSAPGYLGGTVVTTTVVDGQSSAVAATLTPEARLDIQVIDAATGLSLPDMCVAAVSDGEIISCGGWTDSEGKASIHGLPAGTYDLFVFQGVNQCECIAYGAQWVGPHGGTGKRSLAAHLKVTAGQTVQAPLVKMDLAGTLTGQVSLPNGQPATGGSLTLASLGDEPSAGVTIGEDGRFTHHFVGPYEWPVFVTVHGQAPQYAGGTGNYLVAKTVKVTTGKTTVFDIRLRQGVSVATAVTGISGAHGSRVRAFNALTGEQVGTGTLDATGKATFPVIGPQFIRFSVEQRRHSGTFWIPAQGAKTVTLAFS